MRSEAYRYWAFVSYSHQDRKWGEWLIKAIETFPIPGDLVGKDGDYGKIPTKLFPLFRDRDELAVAGNLGEKIENALSQSRFLIVVCSPQSASSEWVNREISTFKALGRSSRVLPIIVDGEPGASSDPGLADSECFPIALRYQIDANGELSDQPAEPLAADVRGGRGAKHDALLQIVAGMLGVSFDALKRRDDARRIRRQRIAIASLTVLTTIVSGLAYYANDRRVVANAQTVVAQARQLASKAQYLEGTDPAGLRAGVLLASQSIRRHRNFEADNLLRKAIRLMPLSVRHFEHGGVLDPLAISAAQNYFAAALADATSRVWDLRDLRETFSVGMAARVVRVAVSDDGQLLATGDREGMVKVWNTATRAEIHATSCRGQVTSLVFGNRGKLLAVACEKASVFVISTEGWSMHAEMDYPGGRGAPVRLAFGHEQLLAVTSKGGLLSWDLASGAQLKHIPGEYPGESCCNAVIAASGRYLAGKIMPGRQLRVWNLDTWELEITIQHDSNIQAMAFGFFSRYFATGDAEGNVQVWDTHNWKRMSRMEHGAEIIHLQFDRQGKRLISASSDRTARIWDPGSGEELQRVNHRGPVAYAGFVQASDRLASFADDGQLSVWQTPGLNFDWRVGGGQALDICVHRNNREITVAFPGYAYRMLQADRSFSKRTPGYLQANDATLSQNCRFGAYIDQDRRGREVLRVFDLNAREELWQLEPRSIESVAFSSDSRYLAVAYRDGEQAAFDVASAAVVASWSADRSRDVRVEFARSGELLASVYERSITFRATGSFDILSNVDLSTRIYGFAAEPAGRFVATATGSGVILIDTASFEQTRLSLLESESQSASDRVERVAFGADKNLLAAAGDSIRVWNTQSKRVLMTVDAVASIEFLAFNSQGDKLIAVERISPAPGVKIYLTRVWEIDSGDELVRISSDHAVGVSALSNDNRILINGAVHPFSVQTLVHDACLRIARDFDAAEWAGLALGIEQTPSCPGLEASTVVNQSD